MIWLGYDMWMTDIYIYIYICCPMIWKWYEICYGTRYVINWHAYDMIYCDAICYGIIYIGWNVMFVGFFALISN